MIEDKHIEFIQKQLRSEMNSYIGKLNTPDIREDLVNTMSRILSEFGNVHRDKIKLDITSDPFDETKVDIEPKNLYTVMLLNGVPIPYELIEGKDSYIINGLLYEYDPVEQKGNVRLI